MRELGLESQCAGAGPNIAPDLKIIGKLRDLSGYFEKKDTFDFN